VTPVRYEASEETPAEKPPGEGGPRGGRTGSIALLITGMVLVVFIAFLFIAGVHRNNQVTQLQHQGVPVDIIVSGCLGVSSGSGSTPASWTCTGSFSVGGHRHKEVIGGVSTFQPVGRHIDGVTVPNNPSLLSTAQAVAHEHPSKSVFVVPVVLLVVLVFLAAWLVRIRRRPAMSAKAI
jgi:hypothetical protein